jgi:hypothetical protein
MSSSGAPVPPFHVAPPSPSDLANFLSKEPAIDRLNFGIAGGAFRVYPAGYRTDVAEVIRRGHVKIMPLGPTKTFRVFYENPNMFFETGFTIKDWRDQAYFVHECTHVLLDWQRLGLHWAKENEAVAFLAEATYLKANGRAPLSPVGVRLVAEKIAAKIVTGTYWISRTELDSLVSEVAKIPAYAWKSVYDSKGIP